MKRLFMFSATFIILFPASLNATVINIPDDYPTIQEGIDASTDGDTVLVQPGTYVENINFNGHNIVLGSLFLTTGDTTYISETVIDGDSSGSVVIFESGEDSTTVITGFTVTNGFSEDGGGICCFDNSNPIIRRNTITGNTAPNQFGNGGGICCRLSHPLIQENVITKNKASGEPGDGGGIFCYYSNAIIAKNLILENYAYGITTGYGAGIYIFSSQPEITGNIIAGNEAPYGIGAAVYCRESDALIINNTITGNSGGESFTMDDCDPIIRNTVIWGNYPSGMDVSNGSPVITYSDIEGNWEGEGNIDADPLFLDPHNWNFNLCSQSPCIDSGDPEIYDPDGTRSDIGVFYPYHPECSWGNIWYVSVDGNDDTGDGSLESPFRTIQHAINGSSHEDTVLVLNGAYVENVVVNYKNIVLASNYIFSSDPADVENTIIDGDSVSTAVGLRFCDSTMAVCGLSITGGNGYYAPGGIECYASAPVLSHNIIFQNSGFEGGGIGCFDSNPSINNNLIRENSAVRGGGIFCYASIPTITNNHIFGNTAIGSGGGINYYRDEAAFVIENNLIDSNSAGAGGGISLLAALAFDAVTRNNLVTNNFAAENGGGIEFFIVQGLRLENYTVTANSAASGGGISCDLSYPYFVNSILWNDGPEEVYSSYSSPEFTFSDIQGGWEGEGNIDLDPLFRDPENGDFHLMSTACGDPYDSPCIDVGDPNIIDSLLDCSWGLGELRSDMGAYGGRDSVTVGIDRDDIPMPQVFSLSQNYPNPFNATTVIRYALPQPAHVKIEIFDILGRRVETIIDQRQPAGYHHIIWNGDRRSVGIYLYKIQAGDYSQTRKMILLK